MRLFYCFLILIIANPSFAVDCHSSDITGGGNFSCDNLYIDSALNFTGNNIGLPVVINVAGNVEINADIVLDGSVGSAIQTGPGGIAGPGGGNGGGYSLGGTENGGDGITSNGKTTIDDLICGNGGGGGAFSTPGADGIVCPTGSQSAALGGTIPVPTMEFDLASFTFRGGYGGGAGAFSNAVTFGSGGGGGGGLFITANGTITVKNGVSITARGGNGGSTNTDGGGGGAGSGGVIYLKSLVGINNKGSYNVNGGTGGRNNSTGAHGGNGGNGLYYFDSAGDITSGSNPTSFASGSSSLSSDISCGTIGKPNENKNLQFQMMLGFGMAMLLSFLFKNRFLKS